MTREELRAHPEYKVCMDKIIGYHPGFRFTMNWAEIPTAKANALKIILQDAIDAGYLESVAIGAGWDDNGNFDLWMDETYKRTDKKGE